MKTNTLFIGLLTGLSISLFISGCTGCGRSSRGDHLSGKGQERSEYASFQWIKFFEEGNFFGTEADNGLTLSVKTNTSTLDSSWTPKWNNLLAYWTFEEDSWNDTKGSNHFIPSTNAGFSATSKIGSRAAYFYGTSDYALANLDELSDFDLDADFSASLWLRMDPSFDYPKTSASKPFQFWCGSRYTANLWINDFYSNGWGGNARFYRWNGIDQPGIWSFRRSYPLPHQLMTQKATYNHYFMIKAGNKMQLFINGELIEQTDTFSSTNAPCNSFSIGHLFKGEIDDVAFWNIALTPAEVETVYSRQSANQSGQFVSPILSNPEIGGSWFNFTWNVDIDYYYEIPPGDESLKGLWHLNETVDKDLDPDFIDSSGNNNDGHLVGTATDNLGRPGRFNQSFFASHSNQPQRIDIPPNDSLNLGNRLTIAAWIQPTHLFGRHTIFSNRWANSPGGWALQVGSFEGETLTVGVVSNSHWNAVTASKSLTNLQWNHIVYSIDGTGSGVQNIYVNGIEIALVIDEASIYSDTIPAPIRSIGSDGNNTDYAFNGLIDEVAIWNRKLSAQEVLRLYRSGANRIKNQVRFCQEPNCFDQEALLQKGWKGPGGDASSFFTALNKSQDSLSGLQNKEYPYVQLKTILENDSTAFNCIDNTTICTPKINYLTVTPQGFDRRFLIK